MTAFRTFRRTCDIGMPPRMEGIWARVVCQDDRRRSARYHVPLLERKSPLLGTLPNILGKRVQLTCGFAAAHRKTVAAGQHTRLEPGERSH